MNQDQRKLVARRATTPAPNDSNGTSRGLPTDLLSEQVGRLVLFSAVGAGLWAFGIVLDRLILPRLPGGVPYDLWKANLIEGLGVAVSVAMFLYMRYSRHSALVKTEAGLVYLVLSAFGIAMLNTWVMTPPTTAEMMKLSWITIAILVYSMIAPSSPRKMLVASMVAASMDPLGVWLAHMRGVPVPSVAQTFMLYLPNYVCALVATLPAHVLQRLGRQLDKAREMGSYQLVERLGQGGMGEVWRAQHRLLARSAAIKLVRPELLGVKSESDARLMLRRFEREAQTTAALNSPHTINLFDFGVTDEGNFYYVMELLAGRDAESLVREFGPVSADRAIYLLRQVCHSLADAHARGLVHRDIKPANIYVCRMGLEYDFVKVLDFGLVKFSGPAGVRQTLVTTDQTPTGTPAYMAPETILGEAEVDRRADVYALGCVAYFLLTGQLVFEADTPMKMIMQHVQAQPVAPSQRTELRIPPELDALVLACLQKDPDQRPQDAGVLFRMACDCQFTASWNQDLARAWWEQHLPELTGPLTLAEPPYETARRPVAVH
jgi:serine/threonine-protein kinase